jgi:Eukaryotic-type carbonic anhydrase
LKTNQILRFFVVSGEFRNNNPYDENNDSSLQLQKFRTLLNKQGQPIRHNRRPTQALNDRKVYFNAAA